MKVSPSLNYQAKGENKVIGDDKVQALILLGESITMAKVLYSNDDLVVSLLNTCERSIMLLMNELQAAYTTIVEMATADGS